MTDTPRSNRLISKGHLKRAVFGTCIGVTLAALLAGCGLQALQEARNEVFPTLPNEPKIGTWYGVYPVGAMSALGEPYHANFKRGASNNVMVLFNGGGVSVNAEMAANPGERYFNTQTGGDVLARFGLGGGDSSSPFADWTVINFPYTTGDFHAGTGEFTFTDQTGKTRTIQHVGYTNFKLVMDEVASQVGTPDNLVIAGYSAGGWGTALLADSVISYFPSATNVTVVVDGALLINEDWPKIAREVWHTPPEIGNRLQSDNITLDALAALAKDHPEAKILFSSSPRDESLVEVQAYFDTGTMRKTAAGGDAFEKTLSQFVSDLKQLSPHTAVYIFEGQKAQEGLTQHTMLMLTAFSDKLGTVTPAQWIKNAVDGNLEDHGLDLLK